MKKVLVITLVLVMALASSAMAAVNFSGDFTATAKMESFKIFTDEFKLTGTPTFTIGASAKNVTVVDEKEVVNWDFTAGLTLDSTTFKVGKYKLGLYDEYFKIWAWGNGEKLNTKSTYFGMISAKEVAAAGTMRARLQVPVLDLATVTADFEAKDTVRAFVEADIEGFDVGLAYLRKGWSGTATNTIVAQVGTAVAAGEAEINLEAAGGITLGDDLGFAVGFGVDTDLTEELNVYASVEHANAKWVGDGVTAEATVLGVGAGYTDAAIKISADVEYTLDGDNDVTLTALYRMSDALTYAQLFHADHWFKNTAPAFKTFATLENFGLGEVGVEVTSPVVVDMAWAKAYGKYGSYTYKDEVQSTEADPVNVTDNGFKVGANFYVQATPKLVVKPFASFESLGKVLVIGSDASYKIGLSSTTLNLTVKNTTAEDIRKSLAASLIQASVKVTF